MDRRKFMTLGLSSATLAALSGCRLRLCGGGMSCSDDYSPYYSYLKSTSLRMFYHGTTLLFLTPEFHLIDEYLIIDDSNPERNVALSKKLFAGLPESLLAKGYLKHGHEEANEDLLFSGKSQDTQVRMEAMEIVWAKSELSAAEAELLDNTMAQYRKQLDAIGGRYTAPPSPMRIIPMDAIFWIASYSAVSPQYRPPALQNEEDRAYEFRYGPGIAEIYAAGSYPADFFNNAKSVDYEPATEIHAQGVKNEPPTSYAWQNRSSPVKIDARGRVTPNGKRFRPLNIRSAFAAKNAV